MSEAYLAGESLQRRDLTQTVAKRFPGAVCAVCVVKYSVLCSLVQETGKAMIHDLQSEVSGEYGKALLILAEVRIILFPFFLKA